MPKISDLHSVTQVLQEFNWDLHLIYNEDLLNICGVNYTEKQYIDMMPNLATRCRIDQADGKKILTIEYVIAETDIPNMCKSMTEFVTSALIQQANIEILNNQKHLLFTIKCALKNHVPNWHITFGTKADALRLICEYEIENLKMV